MDTPSIVVKETLLVGHKKIILPQTQALLATNKNKNFLKEQNNKKIDHIEVTWDPPSIVLKETKMVGHKKIILPQTHALLATNNNKNLCK